MISSVDFDASFDHWQQNEKWNGFFHLSWLSCNNVSNKELKHLKNDFNEGKPFPNSKDGQEVSFEAGLEAFEIIIRSKNKV